MKKSIFTVLPLFLLTSCGGTPASSESPIYNWGDYQIAAPSGAPAIAFYDHLADKNVEISNAQTVQGYFNEAGTKDFIVLPTNAGVKMIQNLNAPFKLAATLTFGNYYMASTGNDADSALGSEDYVVVFQQNQIPDLLFKYIYGEGLNVHYVTDVTAAQRCLISGVDESNSNAKVDYVLMAQPALAGALKQNTNAAIYSDIQKLYNEKSGGKEIRQASIFVKNNVDTGAANYVLNEIKTDMDALLSNPDCLLDSVKASGLEDEIIQQKITNPNMVISLLKSDNKIGIGFKWAYENKASVDAFLETLGQNVTTDEIYFK